MFSRTKTSGEINYELDVLKLFFSLLVFLSHTDTFLNSDTAFQLPYALGTWSVHFFFIVSGLLMVNSYMKNPPTAGPELGAYSYVRKRVLSLLTPYLIALFINYFIFVKISGFSLISFSRLLPQIFFLTATSLDDFSLNSPAWYISAMVLLMLPLYYLLCRNSKFYLYIFSPLMAICVYVYCYNTENHFFLFSDYFGFISGGILLGITGICFGTISYLISQRCPAQKSLLMSVAEILIYVWIFKVWFSPNCDANASYSIMLLMPVAIAISFSKSSYVSLLFRFRFWKYARPLSLAIFLNHASAWRIVTTKFAGMSYSICLVQMCIYTVAVCIVYFVLLKISSIIYSKVSPQIC